MARKVWLVGVGLDGEDGHLRVTKGRDFRLMGGSERTHARMQEQAMRVQQELDRRGKRLSDVAPDEFEEIAKKVGLEPEED